MKTKNISPWFAGLSASVIVLLVKLLKTERFSHIPVYFIFGFIILLIIGLIIFYFNYNKMKWIKYCLSIAATFLIVTYLSVYTFSLSAIFIPHFDEKSYNELKSCSKANEINFELNNIKYQAGTMITKVIISLLFYFITVTERMLQPYLTIYCRMIS